MSQQRVVDVICAYLRMPYTPPAEKWYIRILRAPFPERKIRAALRAALRVVRPAAQGGRDPPEERQSAWRRFSGFLWRDPEFFNTPILQTRCGGGRSTPEGHRGPGRCTG
ncbi:hypothetical protein GCM10010517_23600 [Streptosporangium fragile]|uniref:Uncharacterized protein n=1 Tax=Streptosporangium fragile TaxID=46186 RepID=A0ABN3VWR6_9ACTN